MTNSIIDIIAVMEYEHSYPDTQITRPSPAEAQVFAPPISSDDVLWGTALKPPLVFRPGLPTFLLKPIAIMGGASHPVGYVTAHRGPEHLAPKRLDATYGLSVKGTSKLRFEVPNAKGRTEVKTEIWSAKFRKSANSQEVTPIKVNFTDRSPAAALITPTPTLTATPTAVPPTPQPTATVTPPTPAPTVSPTVTPTPATTTGPVPAAGDVLRAHDLLGRQR